MGNFSLLVQFKIFRDIWQFSYIALFFVLIKIKSEIIQAFTIIPEIISLDIIKNPIVTWMLVLLNFIATIFLLIYGMYEPNIHYLTEANTWKNKGSFSRSFVSYLLTIFTTFYLTFNIYVITYGFLSSTNFLIFLGVVAFIYYDIIFFLILMRRIKRDIPFVQPFDSAGNVIEYSEAQYHALVDKSESPYKSFFNAYTMKWTLYEIFVMLNKIAGLIVVTITAARVSTSFQKNMGVLIIVNAFLFFSEIAKALYYWKLKPFYSIFDNRSCFIGCIMNALLYLLNFFLFIKEGNGEPNAPTQYVSFSTFWSFSLTIMLSWSISSQSVILGQGSFANFQKKYIKKKLDLTPISMKGMPMRAKDCLQNYILFNSDKFDSVDLTILFWNNY